MKKLFEDANILVELDELTNRIFITSKKSGKGEHYTSIESHDDGHISIRVEHYKIHPVMNGFNLWPV